jgi:serine/threonine protein kinase
MLEIDPERRISAREALEHPWYSMQDKLNLSDITDDSGE